MSSINKTRDSNFLVHTIQGPIQFIPQQPFNNVSNANLERPCSRQKVSNKHADRSISRKTAKWFVYEPTKTRSPAMQSSQAAAALCSKMTFAVQNHPITPTLTVFPQIAVKSDCCDESAAIRKETKMSAHQAELLRKKRVCRRISIANLCSS